MIEQSTLLTDCYTTLVITLNFELDEALVRCTGMLIKACIEFDRARSTTNIGNGFQLLTCLSWLFAILLDLTFTKVILSIALYFQACCVLNSSPGQSRGVDRQIPLTVNT